MAGETLKDGAGILAGFPDNVSGLVTPLDSRNAFIADANDVAYLESAAPFTVPAGTASPINSEMVAPVFNGRFWQSDANNALIQSYAADGIPVEPGVQRLVKVSMKLMCEKPAGGTDTYTFQVFIGGVATGAGVAVILTNNTELVSLERAVIYDAVTPLPVDWRVTSLSSLDVTVALFSTLGVML